MSRSSPALALDHEPPRTPIPSDGASPVQGSLFQARESSRTAGRVVQMPARRPGPAAKAHSYRKQTPPQGSEQQRLAFPQGDLGKIPETRAVDCRASVALPVHRLFAASLDGAMVAISFGLFLIVLHLAGASAPLTSRTWPILGAAAFVTLTIYRLIWCLAGVDSIGMRWAGLRLINFDGAEPTRAERLHRMVTSCISASAAGLGLAWALVDEERLTWHDHMSKTFPTPIAPARRPRPTAYAMR
ncbi:MAG: RDD family protein [Bryobacteraceae bacterium]|nr:RDD family protein [Bryobacteraceae bacterium]